MRAHPVPFTIASALTAALLSLVAAAVTNVVTVPGLSPVSDFTTVPSPTLDESPNPR